MPSGGPRLRHDHFKAFRRVGLAMALLGLLPLLVVSAPTAALASTKNANVDGKWTATDPTDPSEHLVFVLTHENLATGDFTGSFPFRFTNVSGVTTVTTLPLTGRVTGNTLTFTAILVPNTVIGTYGAEWVASGTIDGDTAKMSGTTTAWEDGRTVTGSGSGVLTRDSSTYSVSGTVEGDSCSDTSCAEAGLAGQDILVTGTATDGSAVNEVATSADDGTWSVQVPPGQYTAGPTYDDKTIDGGGFDPEKTPLTVDSTDVGDVDFVTCAVPATTTSSGNSGSGDGDERAQVRRVADAAGSRATSSDSAICLGNYTVTLSATIPQTSFLDPASSSAFPTALDGSNYPVDNASGTLINAGLVQITPTFPPCLPATLQRQATAKHLVVHWQTTYKGAGVNLGEITVPLTWNRHTGKVTTAVGRSAYGVEEGHLTRVYKYQLDGGATGSCPETRAVEPEAEVITSGATFTIIASWDFPFPAIDGKSAIIASKVLSPAVEAILAKVPGYERLPKAAKVAIEAAADKLAEVGLSATKAAALIEQLEKLGPAQLAATLDGYLGDYSTMDAIVTGTFSTRPQADLLTLGKRTKYLTDLALRASTDAFPDYHLTVTRNGTSLPWSPIGGVDNNLVTVKANSFVDLKDADLNNSDQGVLSTENLRGGEAAEKQIDAALNIIKNVYVGQFAYSLGSLKGPAACGGADGLCYEFGDARA